VGETAIGMVFVGRVALGADRGRPVMVRRVEKGAEHDDGTLQALREAANEVLAFRHPRVLPGVEARLGTSLVIANGYAEGELLRQLARTARTRAVALAPAVATRLVADLVATLVDVRDALAELGRERPLVGVCPDCVLVDPQGRCHLSDLGLATLRRPPRHAELMAYRAPEQLGPPGEADERSVIFSVGVIWWELLANHSLFGGGSQAAVWQRVRQAAILPPAAASPEARAVLMRALERDPAQRFATLDAFAAALSGLDAGSTAPSEEVARAVDELAGAALRARRAALAAEAPPSGAANAVLTPASALPIGGEDASAAALPRPASFLSTRPAEEVPDEGDWELEGRGAATPAGGSRGSPAPGQRRPGDAAPVTGVAPGSLTAALIELGTGMWGTRSLVRRAAAEFAALADLGREVPSVAVVGEIYVRLDPFANDSLVRKLEDRGLRVRFAPFTEWLEYTTFLGEERVAGGRPTSGDHALGTPLKGLIQRVSSGVLHAAAARAMGWGPPTSVEQTLAAAAPFVDPRLEGEAALTVGAPLHELRDGRIQGVVIVGPHECLPCKVAESQYGKVVETTSFPYLGVAVNGDPVDGELIDRFAYDVHAAHRARKGRWMAPRRLRSSILPVYPGRGRNDAAGAADHVCPRLVADAARTPE